MTWFKVDDSFHSHPKVLAADPAALGLWVVAGAWCGANLTDGFVPDHVLPRLLPDSAELARQLVTVGLWRRSKGGYRFHDWGDYNPNSSAVQKEREAARERMRKLRANRKPQGQTVNGSGEQGANVRGLFGRSSQPRPDPTRRVGVSVGESSSVADARTKNDDDDSKIERRIIEQLADLTGSTVALEWAAKVRAQILAGRSPKDPAAYVAASVRSAPRNYLPTGAGDPSSRSVADAIAESMGNR